MRTRSACRPSPQHRTSRPPADAPAKASLATPSRPIPTPSRASSRWRADDAPRVARLDRLAIGDRAPDAPRPDRVAIADRPVDSLRLDRSAIARRPTDELRSGLFMIGDPPTDDPPPDRLAIASDSSQYLRRDPPSRMCAGILPARRRILPRRAPQSPVRRLLASRSRRLAGDASGGGLGVRRAQRRARGRCSAAVAEEEFVAAAPPGGDASARRCDVIATRSRSGAAVTRSWGPSAGISYSAARAALPIEWNGRTLRAPAFGEGNFVLAGVPDAGGIKHGTVRRGSIPRARTGSTFQSRTRQNAGLSRSGSNREGSSIRCEAPSRFGDSLEGCNIRSEDQGGPQ